MNIQMQDGLPIVSISLTYLGNKMCLDDVLLDTGCATTIFEVDEGWNKEVAVITNFPD